MLIQKYIELITSNIGSMKFELYTDQYVYFNK